MHYFLQVVYTTMQAISFAVFQPWFFIILYLMYWMYKKNQEIEVQSVFLVKTKVYEKMVQPTLSGILVGIGLSIILIYFGIPMHFSAHMAFLLPIALLLALFNFRYLCFSYAGGILGIISLIFRGQKIFTYVVPNINLDIPSIIALVGVLHLMEAWLVFLEGAADSIPIVIQKDNKVAAAYMMQRFWPLPFTLLIMDFVTAVPQQGLIETPNWWPVLKNIIESPSPATILIYSVIPITAVLGYGDIAVSTEPEKKSRKTAILLVFYSLTLIIIAIMSPQRLWLQFLGVILMPLLHEVLIVGSQRKERLSEPLYTYPDKGVRIHELKPEGVAEKIGMKRGDIIVKINGIEIENDRHMQAILNNYYTFLWFDVISVYGEKKYFEYKAYPDGINDIGIIPLMKYHIRVYRLENMENVGLFRMIKK